MTLILAGCTVDGKIVTVADTTIYRGIVFLEPYPIHKIRPIDRNMVMGFSGRFLEPEDTYEYFENEVKSSDITESLERLKKRKKTQYWICWNRTVFRWTSIFVW